MWDHLALAGFAVEVSDHDGSSVWVFGGVAAEFLALFECEAGGYEFVDGDAAGAFAVFLDWAGPAEEVEVGVKDPGVVHGGSSRRWMVLPLERMNSLKYFAPLLR